MSRGVIETYFASGLNLGDENHREWLERVIVEAECPVVFLDTYQRATGGLSSFDDQKQSLILHWLSDLTRKHNIAIVVLDHVRKTDNRGRKRTRVTIDDIKGTGGKAQNADAVILLERGPDKRTVKFRCFSKETDKQIAIQYAVSAQGSSEEKFQFIADLSDSDGSHHVNSDGDAHLVLTKLGPSWMSNRELVQSTGLSPATVRRKLKKLVEDGNVETNGRRGKYTAYRRVEKGVKLLPRLNPSNSEMTN